MAYIPPSRLMKKIALLSQEKAEMSVGGMLLKGFLAGALLAYATAFAFKASAGFSAGTATLVAALVFPVGFAMIMLLGQELATGNFAILRFGVARGHVCFPRTFRNWGWVYLGNFLGCGFFGLLLAFVLTRGFLEDAGVLGDRIVAVALAKTLAYQQAGANGWMTALVKGVLCNWMVALGAVLGLSSKSSVGKIAAVWLPVSTFFSLDLEQSIVNLFLIPTAMVLGAGISIEQWLLWNQLPVTLGNIVGGAFLTGLLLHYGHPAAAVAAER